MELGVGHLLGLLNGPLLTQHQLRKIEGAKGTYSGLFRFRCLAERSPAPECAECADFEKVEFEVERGIGGKAGVGEGEEPGSGGEASTMRGVFGVKGVLLKVDEGPGELNERLIKAAVFILTLQPKML